jgi:hypothetical protein
MFAMVIFLLVSWMFKEIINWRTKEMRGEGYCLLLGASAPSRFIKELPLTKVRN